MKLDQCMFRAAAAYVVKTSLAIAVSLMPVAVSAERIKIDDGFESSTSVYDNWRYSGNRTARIVSSEANAGSRSVEFKVSPADSNNYRTEVTANGGNGFFYPGKDYCINFSFKAKNWSTYPDWYTLFQVHAVPGNENWDCVASRNPLTVAGDGNNMTLNVIRNQKTGPAPGNALANEVVRKKLQLNQWYDYTVYYRPSTKSDGAMEFWENGEKIYSQLNAPNMDMLDACGVPADPATYLKIGLYKADWDTGSQSLYYDSVKVVENPDSCGPAETVESKEAMPEAPKVSVN